jgi:hypothetical protein
MPLLCECVGLIGPEGETALDALLEADLALCLKSPILLLRRVILHHLDLRDITEVALLRAGSRVAPHASDLPLPLLSREGVWLAEGGLQFLDLLLLGDDELLLDGEQVSEALELMLCGLLRSHRESQFPVFPLQLGDCTPQLLLSPREALQDTLQFTATDEVLMGRQNGSA